MTALRITEIFYSIQGESSSVGIPTVFIRLTGCPLRCTYCDTEYAFVGGKKQDISSIIDDVKRYPTSYVTVTGGEPLAQLGCHELMRQLLEAGYTVSLETSGAITVAEVDPRVIKVMDLKTPSSGELTKNIFDNLNYMGKADQVKFVIGNDEDYDWSKKVMSDYNLPERCEILFSPISGQQSHTELAEKILHDGLPVRLQIQLHKLLWQDARGK